MNKQNIEELGFQTKDVYFTGEEVVAYLEEMYDFDEDAQLLCENLNWGLSIKNEKSLQAIKVNMVADYMGV